MLFVLVNWTVSKVNAGLMFLILGKTPRGETFAFLRRFYFITKAENK